MKRLYSIAIEMAEGLQIFRHAMNDEDAARLLNWLGERKENGRIGVFAVVPDDAACPLPDQELLALADPDFIKTLAYLLPEDKK